MKQFKVEQCESGRGWTIIAGVQNHEQAAGSYLQNYLEETGGEVLSGRVAVWTGDGGVSQAKKVVRYDWKASLEPLDDDEDGEVECTLELLEVEE